MPANCVMPCRNDLTNTAREPLAAAALIYALLLSPEENLRATQIAGHREEFFKRGGG
jgi:hypothetical protein